MLDNSKLFTKFVLNIAQHFLALVCLTTGPIVLEDFVNPSKELISGRIFWGGWERGSGEMRLLNEGNGCPVRLVA
jgi:hypothetical protein